MTTITAFIKRHPLLSYFALTFALSWGAVLIVAGGSGGISPTSEASELQELLLYPALLVGPGVAGVLLTGLVDGRVGFREVRSRLLRWRVAAGWYAVALITAPLSVMAALLALSLTSPAFVPGIVTSDDKTALLLIGIFAGLMVGIFEELGWIGFAIPRLRLRYGVLGTGLILGLVWGTWHFPVFFWGSGTPSGAGTVPPALYLLVLLFSWLPAYRVLMMWVYDRTESLLVAILMHASLVASNAILAPLALGGRPPWPMTSYGPPCCGSSLPPSPWPTAGTCRGNRSGRGWLERGRTQRHSNECRPESDTQRAGACATGVHAPIKRQPETMR